MVALFWTALGGVPVAAGETDYGMGYSLSHSSNMTQSADLRIADWTQALFLGFGYLEQTVEVSARLLAQIERRYFLHHTYSSNTFSYVNGSAVWTISPQRFAWSADDIAREVRQDITLADTPTNRAQTNTLSTGPDFSFHPSSVDTTTIGARYGRFALTGGSGDNNRSAGYARWMHRSSARTTLSLNYDAVRLDYDDSDLFNSFLREDRFARYELHSLLDNLTIDAGSTRVTRDRGEVLNNSLARLTASRQILTESSLRISLAKDFSDTGSALLQGIRSATGQADALAPPVTDAVNGGVYKSTHSDLAYLYDSAHIRFLLRGYARNLEFVDSGLEYNEKGSNVDGTWLFSGMTRIRVSTNRLSRRFVTIDQQDKESNTAVNVISQINRNVSITFAVGRAARASTVAIRSFVDWHAMVLLGYSTGPLYAALSRR